MKVLTVSIVKAESVSEAISEALNELSVRSTAKKLADCLVVTGDLGVCAQSLPGDVGIETLTSYFFTTVVGNGFYRVDYCVDSGFESS